MVATLVAASSVTFATPAASATPAVPTVTVHGPSTAHVVTSTTFSVDSALDGEALPGWISLMVNGDARFTAPVEGITTTFEHVSFPSVGIHTVTAQWSDAEQDPTATAVSDALSVEVGKLPVIATLSAGESTVEYGTDVPLSVRVATADNISEIAQGGAVEFLDGDAPVSSDLTINRGAASVTVPSPAVGSHDYVAVFGGSDYTQGATSEIQTVTVTKAQTATSISGSTSVIPGAAATITATVTTTTGVVPTGSVRFVDAALTVLGTAQLSQGVATMPLENLPTGTTDVRAVFAGDSTTTSSTSAPHAIEVGYPTATVELLASTGTAEFGQPISLGATVSGLGESPAGSVAFYAGDVLIDGEILDVGLGQYGITADALPVGTHRLTAVYTPGPGEIGATSAAIEVTITPAVSSMTLSIVSSDATPRVNTPATLTARMVAPLSTTGSVTFTAREYRMDWMTGEFIDITTQLGSAEIIDGVATLIGTLPAGQLTITARYAGSESVAGASASGSIVVYKLIGSGTLTVDTPAPMFGVPVTVTARFTGPDGQPAPAGVVDLHEGSFNNDRHVASGTLSADGTATITYVPSMETGRRELTARLAETATTNAILTPQTGIVIANLPSTTTVTVPSAAAYGGDIVAEIAVTPNFGTLVLGGEVELTVDGAKLPTKYPLVDGSVVVTLSGYAPGPHTIVAAFLPTQRYEVDPSTSAIVTAHVLRAPTTTKLALSASSITVGKDITATATVTNAHGLTLTGDVRFLVDGEYVGASPIAGGTASLQLSGFAAGTRTITAAYVGDTVADRSQQATALVVEKHVSSTTLGVSTAKARFGTSVVLTATVKATATTARGVVEFFDGATSLGTATVTSSGSAAIVVRKPSVGSHRFTAAYRGDESTSSSKSAVATSAIIAAKTSIVVTRSVPTAKPGAAGTLTARVCATVAAGAPTGAVTFTVGSAKVAGKKTTSGPNCTIYTGRFTVAGVGAVKTSAVFAGSGSFASVRSPSASFTATAWATTATAQLNTRTVKVGARAVLAVSVAAPGTRLTPTGKITLKINGKTSTVKAVTLKNGKATVTVPTNKAGTYKVQAVFTPSTKNHRASASTVGATTTLVVK